MDEGLTERPSESKRLVLTSLPHQLQPAALAGEKSPPLSLQGHQAQTGCVRGHPGEEAQGLGPPSGSHSCGLVVQSPLWREVPQRVSQQTPDLSFTRATWFSTVGGEWHGEYTVAQAIFRSLHYCCVTLFSYHIILVLHSRLDHKSLLCL